MRFFFHYAIFNEIFDRKMSNSIKISPEKLSLQLLTCDLGILVTNVNLSTEMSSVSGYNKGLNTTGTRSRGKSEIKQDNFVATSVKVQNYQNPEL